uniref:Large ribosomal subunit protein uL24c n=1 Tax=Taenioma perpusillum TaxID=210852 RepID=A0A1Z1MRU1_9FLOR|nr:ribosomal protein L24 [Taenioma perpusillum]ARW68552.1 ribosomal protein L24 [Taenioma perpusillum]
MKQKKIKFKVGNNVYILTGDDKGRTGKIKKILSSANYLVIEGINIKTKHCKSRNNNEQGKIIQLEAPIHSSNVKNIE